MSDDQEPTIDIEAERTAFIIAREGVHYCDCMLEGWLARARLAAEREREMAAEIRQLYENLKYQRLRNASADDQFHAIAQYFSGKDATNVESGEKTIAGLVKQECDTLLDLLADAQHAVCCYSCPEPREGEPDRHCELCRKITAALKKGPSE